MSLPAVLLAANALLFAAWPWLRALPLGADSTDAPCEVTGKGPTAQRVLQPESVLRNAKYLSSFAEAVRKERAIFLLGTSETVPGFNLGAQLNAVFPEDPSMVVLARAGTSPIHSALLFASCKRERIAIPPLVLVINPVYFAESHDVINDGWMSSIMRSEVFVQLNHRLIMQELSDDVRALYAQHFGLRRFLLPLWAQEYLGNLLYLKLHQNAQPEFPPECLPIGRYEFDGTIPEYDRQRAVHAGYRASDQLAKGRWKVKTTRDCRNLKGLESTAAILENHEAPVLLLMLPANRTFYAYNELDMAEFDRRYRDIRGAIGRLERPGKIFLIDLYQSPWLDLGFADRMHPDAYGFHQMAKYLGQDPTYKRFIEAVLAYYTARPG